MTKAFPNVTELKDKKESFYNFRVRNNEFSFSKAFKICEDLKSNKLIHNNKIELI